MGQLPASASGCRLGSTATSRSRRREMVSSSRPAGRPTKPQSTRPLRIQSSISAYSTPPSSSKRMPGYCSKKDFMMPGSQWTEMLVMVPMRMVPRVRPWSAPIRSVSSRWALHTVRISGSSSAPAGLSATPPRPRTSRLTAHSVSRSAIMRLTALWVYPSSSAARVMLPSSTVLRNAWYLEIPISSSPFHFFMLYMINILLSHICSHCIMKTDKRQD